MALPIKTTLIWCAFYSHHRLVIAEVDVGGHPGIGGGRSLHQFGEVYPILRGTQQIIAFDILVKPLFFWRLRRRVERSGVGRVALDRCNRRSPAREGVGVFGRLGLRRRRAAVDRRRAVLDGRCGGGALAVDVRPRDRVAALHGRKLRRVGGRASHGDDGGRPARERVGVFGSRCLCRHGPAVGRRGAVFGGRCGNGARAVDVRPRDRVAALHGRELRRVGGRASHGDDGGRPAREVYSAVSAFVGVAPPYVGVWPYSAVDVATAPSPSMFAHVIV